jgi:putative transposase
MVIEEANRKHGKPEILNSNQVRQYISAIWTQYLEQEGFRISMYGNGRALDNVWIEGFRKTI